MNRNRKLFFKDKGMLFTAMITPVILIVPFALSCTIVRFTQNVTVIQLSYVTNSGEGEGLIFYGNTIIPFKDRFDNTLMLYALMSSKPEDVEKREKLGIKGRDDS